MAEPTTIIHGAPERTLEIEVRGERPFECVAIYYEAGPESHPAHRSTWQIAHPDAGQAADHAQRLAVGAEGASLPRRLDQLIGLTSLVERLFSSGAAQSIPPEIVEAKRYLERHFSADVHVKDVAGFVGMSESHVSSLFKHYFGIAPLSYVKRLRMERANKLLSQDYLVKEVSRLVGYNDPLYFSKLYKRYFGVAPTAQRKHA